MKYWLALFLFFPFWVVAQNKDFTDKIFDRNIKTVRFHPEAFVQNVSLLPPVMPLGGSLLLSFDVLGTSTARYIAKIRSCTFDWQESQMMESEYLSSFNEFYIQDYENAFNTKIPYTHYRFRVEGIKMSGNYVLQIFDEIGNLVMNRRFCVFENLASISPSFGNITGAEQAFRNQQIDFLVNHNSLDIPNPAEQIKVVLRQNFRWDNAIYQLKATHIKAYQRELLYQYFNMENTFQGGNEFRMFDMRTFQGRGMNIEKIELFPEGNQIFLTPDKSRQGMVYHRIFEDMDGQFFVQRSEGSQHHIEADYAYVWFKLKVDEPANGKVILSGAFADWEICPEYEMIYDQEDNSYKKCVLLKQGYYNYCYVLTNTHYQNPDFIFWEGSHQLTQNSYDIFVYYRPFGSRNERLIAYKSFLRT